MSTPTWPALEPSDPLLLLFNELPSILADAAHASIWGVDLSPVSPPEFGTLIVLSKYLRSNSNDVALAKTKLTETLAWRKEFGLDRSGAGAGGKMEGEDDERFKGLGYVTKVRRAAGGEERVVTWNVYGVAKGDTFLDLDRFLKWRVALMERGVLALALASGTKPIDAYPSPSDPYQMCQVHDYRGVSFLKMDSATKAATKRTIALLSAHYPEMLDKKLFVNVPYLLTWVYSAIKMIVRKETAAKFIVLADGKQVAGVLGVAEDVPIVYGGTGNDLAEIAIYLREKASSGVLSTKEIVEAGAVGGSGVGVSS
ncbi:hypothetical protein RQP46_008809 [Phenoliferia psychrophenolica]